MLRDDLETGLCWVATETFCHLASGQFRLLLPMRLPEECRCSTLVKFNAHPKRGSMLALLNVCFGAVWKGVGWSRRVHSCCAQQIVYSDHKKVAHRKPDHRSQAWVILRQVHLSITLLLFLPMLVAGSVCTLFLTLRLASQVLSETDLYITHNLLSICTSTVNIVQDSCVVFNPVNCKAQGVLCTGV